MKGKRVLRITLDVLLTVMIVFEMLIQFTGEFLHEVVGFAFFATVLAHVLLSMKWVKSTARAANSGKLTARRGALALVGMLLAVTTVVLGVSSVAISGILSSAGFTWPLGSYALWAYVHTVSAYALCALVVVHLAMHWAFLASAFKITYDPSRRRAINAGVNAVAAVGVVALGVAVAGKGLPQASASAATSSASELPDGSGGESSLPASGNNQPDESASTSASGDSNGSSARGKRSRKGSSAAPSSSDSAPSGSSDATPSSSRDTDSSSSAPSGSAPQSSGICTLCRKQCSLSNPKCDRPYAAGLL